MQITLPQNDGTLSAYTLRNPTPPFARVGSRPFNRTVYAAAGVFLTTLAAASISGSASTFNAAGSFSCSNNSVATTCGSAWK